MHRPDLGEAVVGSAYRPEIFYTSDEQRQVAENTVADAQAAALWPGKVVTKISQAGQFWPAGAEDQEYLRHYPAKNQFSSCDLEFRLKNSDEIRAHDLQDHN